MSDPHRFTCSVCGARVRVNAAPPGKRISCPRCHEYLATIPIAPASDNATDSPADPLRRNLAPLLITAVVFAAVGTAGGIALASRWGKRTLYDETPDDRHYWFSQALDFLTRLSGAAARDSLTDGFVRKEFLGLTRSVRQEMRDILTVGGDLIPRGSTVTYAEAHSQFMAIVHRLRESGQLAAD